MYFFLKSEFSIVPNVRPNNSLKKKAGIIVGSRRYKGSIKRGFRTKLFRFSIARTCVINNTQTLNYVTWRPHAISTLIVSAVNRSACITVYLHFFFDTIVFIRPTVNELITIFSYSSGPRTLINTYVIKIVINNFDMFQFMKLWRKICFFVHIVC